MALPPGSHLGPYVVVDSLGAGGMGEVYRARDARLDRDVALKVLPAAFAGDPDRLARFEREVKAVAALSNPHILAVYDVGRADGVLYFAAELVEGSDLRGLLTTERLPLKKALDLAAQIAAGLAAAHEKGVIHRDLKPENILVSRAGHAKIGDFGLAKIALPASGDTISCVPSGPALTETGTVMGTLPYMSPEQAAGRQVDWRSDQFSFGSMLYEMLTGRPAFRRASPAETLAAILHEEPESVLREHPFVPTPLVWILERCLAKEPRERYGSTEDLAKDLERLRDRLSSSSGGTVAAPRSASRKAVTAVVAAVIAFAVLLAYAIWAGRQPKLLPDMLRANIDLPPGVGLASFDETSGATLALSPDGRRLVMVGERDGATELYMRLLDRAEARPIAGTAGARGPFFSPDGQWIGFWADGRLRKVPIAGGGGSVICAATTEDGATWMPDDTILFSTGFGLLRVSAQGGQPQPVSSPDASQSEYAYTWPSRLPGTSAVLFTIKYAGQGPQASSVALLSLDKRHWTTLVRGATEPRYIAPGFLIVNRSGSLVAAPFDLTRLAVSEPFKPLEEGEPLAGVRQIESYDVSTSDSSLVYASTQLTAQERTLYSVDFQGKAESITSDRKAYWGPTVSPDGSKLAVTVWIDARVSEIWVLDLIRRTWLRLTTGSNDWQPAWKDSQTLIYVTGRDGGTAAWDEHSLPATGNAAPTLLASFPHQIAAHALSPDRRQVVFSTIGESSYDLWLQPVDLHAEARPFLVTSADESTISRSFSPDGRWLAYTSNATGRSEVYVTDFPSGTAHYRVSTAGGIFPCWSHDGRQIFYWQGKRMMAVTVGKGGHFAVDDPRALFDSPVEAFQEFDLAPDGSRFYVVGAESRSRASQIVFVTDVSADLPPKAAAR